MTQRAYLLGGRVAGDASTGRRQDEVAIDPDQAHELVASWSEKLGVSCEELCRTAEAATPAVRRS